jgi:hypothetical protein
VFCLNCGNRINENARYCASCGAAQRRENSVLPPSSVPAVLVSDRPTAPRKPLKDRIMGLLMIPVAVILILLGTGQLALGAVGSTATAQVTGYEQKYIINNDESTRNPSRYKLEYQFSVNGERYSGSVTRVFPGGSHMRQTIPVRYLPFWPHVNAEDGETAGLAGPVMTGLGALLLVITVKRKSRFRNKSR